MDNEPKLEWMYKGLSGAVDREEYLTGRKIDKTFELIEQEESGKKGDFDDIEGAIPGSIFASSGSGNATVTVDLATKLREDPLYEIRKTETEKKKEILKNPVKMKRLKNMLQNALIEDLKKKKSKRHHHSSSSSSDSSEDEKRRHRHSQRSQRDLKDNKYSRHRNHSRSRSKSPPTSRHRRYSPPRQKERTSSERHSRNDSNYKSQSSKPHTSKTNFKQSSNQRPQRSKLSAEEMEKKRKEMMQDAKLRDEQRKQNVKSYNDEEEKEKQESESGRPAQFIKPLLKEASELNSLEKRIQQKRFTSERGYNAMDRNFAKKY